MGYRIHYSLQDGTLSAVVSGQSTPASAGCIARDIAAQAAWQAAGRVLIDLRWLGDKVGLRGLLSLPRLRVAVVDTGEGADGERGELRYFNDARTALRWLKDEADGDAWSASGDRNRPAAAGAPCRAPLAIFGG